MRDGELLVNGKFWLIGVCYVCRLYDLQLWCHMLQRWVAFGGSREKLMPKSHWGPTTTTFMFSHWLAQSVPWPTGPNSTCPLGYPELFREEALKPGGRSLKSLRNTLPWGGHSSHEEWMAGPKVGATVTRVGSGETTPCIFESASSVQTHDLGTKGQQAYSRGERATIVSVCSSPDIFQLPFFFSFFFPWPWKFSGQGSNPHHNSNRSFCSDTTGSLTYCATSTRELSTFFLSGTMRQTVLWTA